MANPPEPPVFETLLEHVSRPCLEDAFAKALAYRKNPGPGRKRLVDVINVAVRYGRLSPLGFRNPIDAPTARLARSLKAPFENISFVTEAVLGLWTEALKPLRENVTSFAELKGLSVCPTPHLHHWDAAQLQEAAAELGSDHPEYSVEEIRLMLLLCAGTEAHGTPKDEQDHEGAKPAQSPLTEESTPSVSTEQPLSLTVTEDRTAAAGSKELPGLLGEWLRALVNLPADALEWDGLDSFIERAIGHRERNRTSLAQERNVRARLSTFAELHAPELDYFEIATPQHWTADRLLLTNVDVLMPGLDELSCLLTEAAIVRKEQAVTGLEERRRMDRLDQVAAEVRDLIEKIDALLSSRPPELPPRNPKETSDDGDPDLVGGAEGNKRSCDDSFALQTTNVVYSPTSTPNVILLSDPSGDSVRSGGVTQPDLLPPDNPATIGTDKGEVTSEVPPPPVPEGKAATPLLQADASAPSLISWPVEVLAAPASPTTLISRASAPQPTPSVVDSVTANVKQTLPHAVRPAAERIKNEERAENVACADKALAVVTAQVTHPSPQQAAAQVLRSEGSSSSAIALGLSLLAEGDFLGGYWCARAAEELGETGLPSWLLEALVGSLQLRGDSSPMVPRLLELTSKHSYPDNSAQPLATAAAIAGAIRAPATGLNAWLRTPSDMPFLHAVVEPIRRFAESAYVSVPADIDALLGDSDERGAQIVAAACAVSNWRGDVHRKRTAYGRATNVWLELLRREDFANALGVAASDDRSRHEEVDAFLQQWRSRIHVEKLIQGLGRERSINKNDRPIVGAALKWITDRIDEATSLLQRWTDLVTFDGKLTSRPDWLTQQLRELQQGVRSGLKEIGLPLAKVEAASAVGAASSTAIRFAVKGLCDLLCCDLPPQLHAKLDRIPFALPLIEETTSLESLLAKRLILLPKLHLPKDASQWGQHLADVLRELAVQRRSSASLSDVILGWIEQSDFRFVDELILCLDPAQRPSIEERRRVAVEAARADTRTMVERIRHNIEAATVDGVIEDERAELLGRLDAVRVEEAVNFRDARERLDEIQKQLDAARQQNLEDAKRRWEEVRRELRNSNWSHDEQAIAISRVEEVLKAGDYRGGDELLSRLSEILEFQRPFEPVLFALPPSPPLRQLESFLDVLSRFQANLHMVRGRDAPKRAQEILGAALPRVEARRDLRAAYEDWDELASSRRNPARILAASTSVLRNIGYLLEEPGAVEIVRESRTLELRARAFSQKSCFVPHLGSRVDGRLRVFLVWNQDNVDALAHMLTEPKTEGQGVVVILLDRMDLQRRRQLAQQLRSHGGTIAVLDEWLYLFCVAQPDDARLRAFFECALAFVPINPYVARGPVAPEMFVGREQMVRELASFEGSCLVYGGRQLGKSALLEHVHRRFVADDPKQHVSVLIDIQQVGDPASAQPSPEAIWPKMRDALKREKLLPQRISTDKPSELATHIAHALQSTGKKLLILLDEADHFLDADAKQGFDQVKRLRALMTDNLGRCKVVLAGLHNVQRFQGIPNQPLAHFGTALLVGPLEPRDADALIREPLEGLGFRFDPQEKNGAILRILSYTNYHPGLIQAFCRELVTIVHRRASSASAPPFILHERDVEEVYGRPETRQQIKDRFEWTLALDPRYQAVVWSLVVHQHDQGDGYGRSFSATEILRQVKPFWSQGFANMDSEEMRSLLGEMVGLGVLLRSSRDEYRVRSPNVVRLLGHVDTVWAHLQDLEAKPAPVAFDADNHHVKLGSDKGITRYSPFTYSQERSLLETRSETLLLVGCVATNFADVAKALERACQSSEPSSSGAFGKIPTGVRTLPDLNAHVAALLAADRTADPLVLYRELSAKEVADGLVVDAAMQLCATWQKKRQRVKVVLGLRPFGLWTWLKRDDPSVDLPTMILRRWTRPGLDQLLDDADIRSADEQLRRRLLEITTGGWPYLLRDFVAHVRELGDERKALEHMERQLAPGGPAAPELWSNLELDPIPRVTEVIRLIGRDDVPPDQDFEGVFEGDLTDFQGRSELLLKLLSMLGVLEQRGTLLHLERRVAATCL